MTSNVRVRFAPSPTGYLHIGGVRTALFNWLYARKTAGTFVLRIEDTDQERSTAASKAVIFESLDWLGIDWDEGPRIGGPHGPYEQMERLAIYKDWSEKLVATRRAYRCFCTKEELDRARAALKARDPKASFVYPGTCRDRRDEPGRPFSVRFRSPREGAVTYVDKVFGEVTTPNSAQQDFVLVRTDGIPLYNFGVVVDDVTMGITLVARGRDHMVNTPPQILLYEAMDAKTPEFAHLPMMLAPSGEKLSKRHGAVSVGEYKEQGYLPDAVLSYLVRFGWSHGDQEVFSKRQLIDAFNWEACGRGDGKFDPKKFLAIQYDFMKSEALLSDDDYAAGTVPFLEKRGIKGVHKDDVKRAVFTIRARAKTLVEAAEALDYFFRADGELVFDPKAEAKFLTEGAAPILTELAALLAASDPWTEVALEARVQAWLGETKRDIKDVAQPARVALSGRSATPGLFQVLVVLGKARSVARLEAGAERAKLRTMR